MSNIRLFFKESLSLNLTAKLNKSQSHYVNKVMRIKVGEVFSLFNSSGEWESKILTISKSIVEFNITKQLRQKENVKELWLAFSPIKSNYFNFMIQKATELGVTKFIPIIFDRTIVRKIRLVPDNAEQIEGKVNGDTIVVNPGTYRETIDFAGKRIVLTSTYMFNQDTNLIASTKLDLQDAGVNGGVYSSIDNYNFKKI